MNRFFHSLSILLLLITILACRKLTMPSWEGWKPSATNPTQVGSAPSNPCENVFLPYSLGNQWIYLVERAEGEGPQLNLTVSSVEDEQATLDMLDISSGAIVQSRVECEDGAIKNYPILSLGTFFGDTVGGEVTISSVSGRYMPAKEDFLAAGWDLAWSGEYLANGTVTFDNQGQQITIILDDSPARMLWQVEGQEPVTVPAGIFDQAYKVTRRVDMGVKIDLGGLRVQAKLIIDTEHWYEPRVGLLKIKVDAANLEYMGISLPVSIQGEVKLVEFRTGQ